jgi:hypothetical protein
MAEVKAKEEVSVSLLIKKIVAGKNVLVNVLFNHISEE